MGGTSGLFLLQGNWLGIGLRNEFLMRSSQFSFEIHLRNCANYYPTILEVASAIYEGFRGLHGLKMVSLVMAR